MKKGAWITIKLGTVILSILAVWLFFYGDLVLNLFARNEAMKELAKTPLQMICFAFPFLTLANVSNMTWQAMGKPLFASVLAAMRQGVFFLPLVSLLLYFYQERGLYLAQPLSDIITFAVSIPFLAAAFRTRT